MRPSAATLIFVEEELSCKRFGIDPGDQIGQRRPAIVMPGEGRKLHAASRTKTGNTEAEENVFQARG